MFYEEHERDAEWQATYQRCVNAFLQRVRSLHPDDPMAYDTPAHEHWIHEVAEEEADRDLAQRIDRAGQAELAQIQDEARADLWEGWYGFDGDDPLSTISSFA